MVVAQVGVDAFVERFLETTVLCESQTSAGSFPVKIHINIVLQEIKKSIPQAQSVILSFKTVINLLIDY